MSEKIYYIDFEKRKYIIEIKCLLFINQSIGYQLSYCPLHITADMNNFNA